MHRGPLSALVAASVTVIAQPSPSPTPPPSRTAVIISDLHFGVGKEPGAGEWHAYEDFRWKDEFVRFLGEIDAAGGGRTDLILNGDTFELWQSLQDDCSGAGKDAGCTEADALARLRRVLDAHRDEMRALGDFARSRENRVIVVPGNHDAALLFPSVAQAARQATGDTAGRVRIATEGYWLSPDGLVFAEHGHQVGKDVNRWDNWPAPFTSDRRRLQRPWGEQFVQQYYNQFEKKYPIIDNISSEAEGVRYGLAAEGAAGALKDLGGFVRFFLLDVSAAQLGGFLGEAGGAPKWDIEAILRQGPVFMVESLPAEHPLREHARKAHDEGELAASFAALTPGDLRAICDQRAAQRRDAQASGGAPPVTECPRVGGTLGATRESLSKTREEVLAQHLQRTCQSLAGCAEKPFALFVYSHTHLAARAFSPLRESWQPLVINTGAWQRTITPAELEALKQQLGLAKAEVLPAIGPEKLPACYSFVVADQTGRAESLSPRLRFWTDRGGQWKVAEACDGR